MEEIGREDRAAEEVLKSVLVFLKVAVETILFSREAYPPETFEKTRVFGILTPTTRSKLLRNYIETVFSELGPWIEADLVERVSVAFWSPDKVLLEKFTFEMHFHPENKPATANDTENAFRSFLLKIGVCDSLLKEIPKGSPWSIVVQKNSVTEEFNSESQKSDKWVTAGDGELQNGEIIPLKSFTTGFMKLQLFVEQQ
jgi:hypothetical protein